MLADWLWLLSLSALLAAAQSLPAGLASDEAKKTEQTARPKVVKRSQELLMFGNQQNHQAKENNAANNHPPAVEKRTLSNSGLEDVSAALSDSEPANRPKALPNTYMMDQPALPQHEKNYEYGRILVNELDDVLPRGPWDLGAGGPALYGRYYGGLSAEERRKRSEDSNSPTAASAGPASSSSATSSKPLASSSTVSPAAAPAASAPASQLVLSQPKRSVASYYQEPRYKRESDVDPDKLYALLSLYDNERRNRGNWRNYGNDEYEAVDDDSNMIGLDDEDPSAGSWLDNSLAGYPGQQHRYIASEPLLNSELAALGHASRPYGYYDQYLGQQYAGASGAGQQYDSGVQYGTPQYAVPYAVHGSYYPPEKRFMVSRKRSQNYDSYGARSGLLVNTRAYPGYQHRLLY